MPEVRHETDLRRRRQTVRKIFSPRRKPEWWDDADTWLNVGDTLCAVGPWLMIVLVLALVVSAL